MANEISGEVTILLRRVADGCGLSQVRLAELAYAELRRLAAAQLRGMRGHTLQPTALVHEAWLRLAGSGAEHENRGHFLAAAAKAMRCVLVDHSRRRLSEKRGGNRQRTSLDAVVQSFDCDEATLLDLDAALGDLERADAGLARLVEMRFFSGMTHPEIAAAQQCSLSSVERGWRLARAFLLQRLEGERGRCGTTNPPSEPGEPAP